MEKMWHCGERNFYFEKPNATYRFAGINIMFLYNNFKSIAKQTTLNSSIMISDNKLNQFKFSIYWSKTILFIFVLQCISKIRLYSVWLILLLVMLWKVCNALLYLLYLFCCYCLMPIIASTFVSNCRQSMKKGWSTCKKI